MLGLMKALLLQEPVELAAVEVNAPQPGPGEVRIRVAACGI
jgi:NADPH:quinone reductase-like Zn-dependent oxidoreductase